MAGVLLGALSEVHAGNVRTINVDEKIMAPIYLQMGRSTVIHFFERPQKIIAGNQNYFNIEFTGNDVTIQPLGAIPSNLFVYGEFHRFGFLLKVNQDGAYDDLVNVKWASARVQSVPFFQETESAVNDTKPETHEIKNIKTTIKGNIEMRVLKTIFDKFRDLHIVEVELKNKSDGEVALEKTAFLATRSGIPLPINEVIFEENVLKGEGRTTKARIFLKLTERAAFTLRLAMGGKSTKVIIPASKL